MAESRERPLIVIVENDQQLADALSMLVHDWGFEALPAKSAAAAVRALGSRIAKVSAIISDYQLDEGFTGIKGATAIAQAIGHKVPTIVTTGHTMLAEHENVFPVLAKPFDPGVLHRWLTDHVERPAGWVAA